MALTPGTRLGVYEVIAQIGEGAMGQVYRATDTTLGRHVAIKILPDAFASDPDRLVRFEREAKTLASLNHPYIAAIYGFEKSGGMHALVMELVEGDDLSQRIARGAIPIDEALPIAKQIAEALEAAHEQGIVHRDLKPANIKVRADGTVKVLDFGLAKLAEAGVAGGPDLENLTQSATSPAMTQAGVILGTAAYMSPEQARGTTVDKRADVWAFGTVLYEMLTSRRAFLGEAITDTIVSVVSKEPDWGALPTSMPAGLRRLLTRCLKKDTKARLRDIGEARVLIDEMLSGAPEEMPPAATAALSALQGTRLAWMVFATVLLAAAALAIPAMRYLRETPPTALPAMRVDINTPQTPQPLQFALSPDGMRLVFVAAGNGPPRLWIRSLDAVAAQALPGTAGASFPFWSFDGRSVGFFADGKLKRIDIGGGPPQALADAPAGRGGAWSRDGTIVFAASNASPLWSVSASGGQPVAITKLDLPRQGSHRLPQFLPDGRHFLFFAQGNPDAQGIYLGSLDDGATKRLTAADAAGAYMEPGLLVFNRQGVLVAHHLDVPSGALTGDPVTVAEAVDYDWGYNLGGFSISTAGRVAYRVGGVGSQLRWFDRAGTPAGVAGEPGASRLTSPELSPDGRHVAVMRDVLNNRDIWLIDLLRGGATRFTSDAAVDSYPLWSSDGTRISFNSNRQGIFDLYVKPSDGARSEELLLESPRTKIPVDWSRDGRFLLYQEVDPQTGWDVWALPMSGDRTRIAIANTSFEERSGQFSPDGRWVAYQSNVTGPFEIYVRPFPGPGGTWKVSAMGGTDPRWRADGRELFFIAPDAKLMAASVRTSSSSLEAGSPTALFQTRIVTASTLKHEYVVSANGRFLVNTTFDDAPSSITLLLNWKPPTK